MLIRSSIAALFACYAALPFNAHASSLSEYGCQSTIGKAGAKLAKRVHLAELKCADANAAGRSCDQGLVTRQRAAAEAALSDKLTGRCGPPITLANLGYPGPCNDANGPPFTIDELVPCIRDSHEALVNGAVLVEYPIAAGSVAGADLICQRRIGSAGLRFIAKNLKLRQRCLNYQLRGKLGAAVDCRADVPPFGPGTGDSRTDVRLGRAIDALSAKLARDCANVTLEDLGFPGPCPDPDGSPFSLANLKACMRDTHELRATRMLDFEYPQGVPTPTPTPTPTRTPTPTPTGVMPTGNTTPMPTPTLGSGVAGLAGIVGPEGDADGDGFSNMLELAQCSNPADPASTPLNDHSLCANATIFSDTLGPAWGETNHLTEPTYNAAVAALMAQNAVDCGAYCTTTPNIGSPEACAGNWPWSGVPQHGFYEQGETVEVNFPDENGNRLAGTVFLPPGVTCLPDTEPVCDGVTDGVTCSAPGGATYPAVVITDGFTGTQRMYFWAAHRLAAQGYITMTFDVSGQGRSQGSFPNGDQTIAADQQSGTASSAFSRDLGAAMNWFVSPLNPVRGLVAVSPMVIPNQATGATDQNEPYVLGAAGHSAGATGVIAYQQSTETMFYPARARAVVGWSAFDANGTIGNVPIQIHTGDEDSGFIQPPGSGTVAPDNEKRYDRLAGDRDLNTVPDFTPHDRQIVVTEQGTHLSYSQVPWAYTPTWAEEVQYHYTLAWFDKYLHGDVSRTMSGVAGGVIQSVAPSDYAECASGPTCFSATARLEFSHVHLSPTWCSRYVLGGDVSINMKGGSCATR